MGIIQGVEKHTGEKKTRVEEDNEKVNNDETDLEKYSTLNIQVHFLCFSKAENFGEFPPGSFTKNLRLIYITHLTIQYSAIKKHSYFLYF